MKKTKSKSNKSIELTKELEEKIKTKFQARKNLVDNLRKQPDIIFESEEAWMNKGKQLFGNDLMEWKFVCSSCGNIQSPKDFKDYQHKGATPSSAYWNCIGRYKGTRNEIFSKKQPCNYSSGGLFNVNKTVVKYPTEFRELRVFNFYEKNRKSISISLAIERTGIGLAVNNPNTNPNSSFSIGSSTFVDRDKAYLRFTKERSTYENYDVCHRQYIGSIELYKQSTDEFLANIYYPLNDNKALLKAKDKIIKYANNLDLIVINEKNTISPVKTLTLNTQSSLN